MLSFFIQEETNDRIKMQAPFLWVVEEVEMTPNKYKKNLLCLHHYLAISLRSPTTDLHFLIWLTQPQNIDFVISIQGNNCWHSHRWHFYGRREECWYKQTANFILKFKLDLSVNWYLWSSMYRMLPLWFILLCNHKKKKKLWSTLCC